MTFDECCKALIAAESRGAMMDFAKAYARAGLGMTGDAARTQALYIVSNLSGWRGPEAKAVRAELRRIGEVK